MNYVKIYRQLILKRRQNPIYKNSKQPGLIHYHHIFPVSCGGTPDKKDQVNRPGSNLIGLTRKEHFVAHHLLKKICEHSKNKNIANAMNYTFRMMCGLVRNQKWKEIRTTARIYANACNDAALNRDRHLSESHKAKIKAALSTPEMKKHLSLISKGRKYGIVAKQHMSEAQQKRRDAISRQFKGKPKSEEHKLKISLAQRGKIISEEQRMKNKLATYKHYIMRDICFFLFILMSGEK